jgi:hypothetical protein
MVSLQLLILVGGEAQHAMSINALPSVSVTRDWVDYVALIFSAALMIVGIVGVIAALKTLRAIKKQADEMVEQAALMKEQTAVAEKAANAALLNAKALIVSERPWLVVNIAVHETDSHMYVVSAKNKGRTPAILHEGHCSCVVQSAYRFTPPSNIFDPFYAPIDNLTMSGEGFKIRELSPDKGNFQSAPDLTETGALYVYGRLVYWDTFTDQKAPDAVPYVTQWCFAYNAVGNHFQRAATDFAQNT